LASFATFDWDCSLVDGPVDAFALHSDLVVALFLIFRRRSWKELQDPVAGKYLLMIELTEAIEE